MFSVFLTILGLRLKTIIFLARAVELRVYNETIMSIALATTWEDRLHDLGNIPTSRVRMNPTPGTATVDDVTHLRNTERRLYELVDGTLVEKSMGWQESLLAGILLQWLNNYLDAHRIGVATGADGMTRLFGDTVRGPDVAFVAWDRMPNGRIPTDPIPDLVPNFVPRPQGRLGTTIMAV